MGDELEEQSQSDSMEYWRLCEELTVCQAALLAIGENPSHWRKISRASTEHLPTPYEAMATAIQNALRSGRIKGTLENETEYGPSGPEPVFGTVDVHTSRVEVESLKDWLIARDHHRGFFFKVQTNKTPDYLNPEHPRYAPKLAAAVRAWLAVSESPGKTPKQVLKKWLSENATCLAPILCTSDVGIY